MVVKIKPVAQDGTSTRDRRSILGLGTKYSIKIAAAKVLRDGKEFVKIVKEVAEDVKTIKEGVEEIKGGIDRIEGDGIENKIVGGVDTVKGIADVGKTVLKSKKLGAISDVLSVGRGIQDIFNCIKRGDGDNPCKTKEQMDNIKSLACSAVSFMANVGVKVPGPVAIVFTIGKEAYDGVAQVVDYREKYGTTDEENWSVFWRTLARQPMSRDVSLLKVRTDVVNSLADKAWDFLDNGPDNVIAYGVGLGEIEEIKHEGCAFENWFKCISGGLGITDYGSYYDSSSSRATIMMNRTDADTSNLSRVLPKPIKNAKMICLPQVTGAEYEKGMKKSVETAVHYCKNAMVIVDKRKSFEDGKAVVYDLDNVNNGNIVGSNKLNNNFLVFPGKVKFPKGNRYNVVNLELTGGDNVVNRFIVREGPIRAKFVPGKNATNIFDFSQMQASDHVEAYIGYDSGSVLVQWGTMVRIDDITTGLEGNVHANINAHLSTNHYFGAKNRVDMVSCTGNSTDYHIMINSGGGSDAEKDKIKNCSRVTILPYTDVHGTVSDYVYYVDTGSYKGVDLRSEVDVEGKGSIVFPKIDLLNNFRKVTYSPNNSTLSLEVEFGQHELFTLDIKNYAKNSGKPDIMLVDKKGNKITPVIKGSGLHSTIVDSFESHTERSLDDFNDIEDYYQTLLNNTGNYKILGIVKDKVKDEHMIFGSIGNDVINIDEGTIFSRGGEGRDMYVVSSDLGRKKVIIDNNSDDKELDTIHISEISKKFLIQHDDLYLDHSGTNIQVKNYLHGDNYRHLMVMNSKGETFIPYMENKELVPFFHATQTSNLFLLTKDFQHDYVVFDSHSKDIGRFRNKNDLLLMRDSSNGIVPFNIIIKDFYEDRNKWQGVNVLLWNNGNFSRYIGLKEGLDEIISLQDKLKTSYEKAVKKYVVDFTRSINITHNQIDDLTPVTEDEKRIGIVVLKNTAPDQAEISSSGINLVFHNKQSNHTVTVKNWGNSESCRVSTLEFGSELDPIKISGLNRFGLSNIAEMRDLINKASKSYQKKNEYSPRVVRDLKCSASVDGFENGYMMYKCLGFSSLREQINFVEDLCTKEQVEEFRSEMPNNNQILPLVEKLINDLSLSGFNRDMIDQCFSSLTSESTIKELIDNQVIREEGRKRSRRHDSSIIRELSLGNTANKKLKKLNSEVLNELLAQFKCLVHQQPNDFQHNRDRLQNILQENKGVEALVWLIVREYSILSLEHPNRTKDLLLKDLDRCFNTVIDERSIASLVKHLNRDDVVLRVEEFIRDRRVELEKKIPHSSQQLEHSHHLLMTSGAAKLASPINGFFCWLKDCVSGLFGSKDVSSGKLPTQGLTKENISNFKPKVTTLKADLSQVDVDGTILLLDTFIRKFTGQKHVSSSARSIPEQEALGYALNITTEFERVLKDTAKRSGVSVNKSSFDFSEIYNGIKGKMISGELSKIPTILYSAIEEAYPKNEKFLGILKGNIEKMLDGQQVVNNVHNGNQMQNTIGVNDKMPLSSLNSIAIEPLSGKKGVTCAGRVA